MLTIYSIAQAVSSSRLRFPSVMGGEAVDFEIECRGRSFSPGRDYLVFGEVQDLGGRKILGVCFADTMDGVPHFCRVSGRGNDAGVCGGFKTGVVGEFAGELLAVEGERIFLSFVLRREEGRVEPVLDSPQITTGCGADLQERGETKDGGALGSECMGSQCGVSKTVKPTAVAIKDDLVGKAEKTEKQVNSGQVPSEASDLDWGGAGVMEGSKSFPLEGGGALKVSQPVEAEAFPVADKLPALGEVKREELARKAEARKKADTPGPKKAAAGDGKVSKGGLRLGKDSPSDKGGALQQNAIDESELW
jgi:hypothetical protein